MSCTVQCSNHNTNDLCAFVWDMNILKSDETIRLIKKKEWLKFIETYDKDVDLSL